MIYAIVISAVITLVIYKKIRKYLAIGFVVIVSVYIVVQGPVYRGILGVGPGDAKEMLSVPISQIARVYVLREDELTGDERQKIEEFMPTAEDYDEIFADPVKNYVTGFAGSREGRAEFAELWTDLLLKYPLDYIEAFLTLNVPYWCPEAESGRTYIELGNYSSYYTFEYREWLPHVNGFYRKVAANTGGEHGLGIMNGPVFRQIFSLSTPFWLLIIMVLSLAARKKGNYIVPFLPVIFLWLTYMLGPVSNFRYIYPIFILYPVIICYIAGGVPIKD